MEFLLGLIDLHPIRESWLQSRQTKTQSSGGDEQIDERIVVISIHVKETNGWVIVVVIAGATALAIVTIIMAVRSPLLVFLLKNFHGHKLQRNVHLNLSILHFAHGLYFGVVSMHFVTLFTPLVFRIGFGKKVFKVLFFFFHKIKTFQANQDMHVFGSIDLEGDGVEETVSASGGLCWVHSWWA